MFLRYFEKRSKKIPLFSCTITILDHTLYGKVIKIRGAFSAPVWSIKQNNHSLWTNKNPKTLCDTIQKTKFTWQDRIIISSERQKPSSRNLNANKCYLLMVYMINNVSFLPSSANRSTIDIYVFLIQKMETKKKMILSMLRHKTPDIKLRIDLEICMYIIYLLEYSLEGLTFIISLFNYKYSIGFEPFRNSRKNIYNKKEWLWKSYIPNYSL